MNIYIYIHIYIGIYIYIINIYTYMSMYIYIYVILYSRHSELNSGSFFLSASHESLSKKDGGRNGW